MAPVLSRSLTPASIASLPYSPLFSSNSKTTQNRLSLRSVFLHQNKSLSGLKLKVENKGASIDLKLPRRSLLVHFTCDACGERSQKLINRLAYEKGTVFVQCSGCLKYHSLVDNLNLVVEYNFLEETSDTEEV